MEESYSTWALSELGQGADLGLQTWEREACPVSPDVVSMAPLTAGQGTAPEPPSF